MGIVLQPEIGHGAVAVGSGLFENLEGLGVAGDGLTVLFALHELVAFEAFVLSFALLGNTARNSRVAALILLVLVEGRRVSVLRALLQLAVSVIHFFQKLEHISVGCLLLIWCVVIKVLLCLVFGIEFFQFLETVIGQVWEAAIFLHALVRQTNLSLVRAGVNPRIVALVNVEGLSGLRLRG